MPVALLNHVSCRFQGPHESVFRVGTSAKLQTARQSPRAAARKAGESRRRVPARAVHRSELASYLLGSQEQREPLRPARRREANRLLRGSSKFGCFFSNASSLVRCAGRRERANSVGRNVRGWTRHFLWTSQNLRPAALWPCLCRVSSGGLSAIPQGKAAAYFPFMALRCAERLIFHTSAIRWLNA